MNRFFRGQELQKGYGLGRRTQIGGFSLGGLFKRFFSYLTPYLHKAKKVALPIIQSGAKSVGQEVVKTAAEIAKDVIDGKEFTPSAKEHISKGIGNLASQAQASMRGEGYKYKRKKTQNNKNPKKKYRTLDIFD